MDESNDISHVNSDDEQQEYDDYYGGRGQRKGSINQRAVLERRNFSSIADTSMKEIAEMCSNWIIHGESDKLIEYLDKLPRH